MLASRGALVLSHQTYGAIGYGPIRYVSRQSTRDSDECRLRHFGTVPNEKRIHSADSNTMVVERLAHLVRELFSHLPHSNETVLLGQADCRA